MSALFLERNLAPLTDRCGFGYYLLKWRLSGCFSAWDVPHYSQYVYIAIAYDDVFSFL